jgi:hypothetical protein
MPDTRETEFNTLPEFWRVYIMGLEAATVIAARSRDLPAVSDTYTPEDWCGIIQDCIYRARMSCLTINETMESGITLQLSQSKTEYENRLKDVAYLALSAILSSIRRT